MVPVIENVKPQTKTFVEPHGLVEVAVVILTATLCLTAPPRSARVGVDRYSSNLRDARVYAITVRFYHSARLVGAVVPCSFISINGYGRWPGCSCAVDKFFKRVLFPSTSTCRPHRSLVPESMTAVIHGDGLGSSTAATEVAVLGSDILLSVSSARSFRSFGALSRKKFRRSAT